MNKCPCCDHESGWDIDRGDVNPYEGFYELPGPVVARQSGLYGDSAKFNLYVCPKCGNVHAERTW